MNYALAGAYVGLSARSVRRCVQEGAIASIALGSRRVIERSELDRYLAASRTRQTPRTRRRVR